MRCFVCGEEAGAAYREMARHFLDHASASDPDHVMWMNRNLTRKKVSEAALAEQLQAFDRAGDRLVPWIKRTFVERFLGEPPHPFVQAMQRPTRAVLLGYVVEHQHFLRQWVRTCASVIAKTEKRDVTLYEIDNIATEFGGVAGQPSHYELLLRMGESLGLPREEVLSTAPLPRTRQAVAFWRELAEKGHWVDTMAAMHSLELIANRRMGEEGASVTYFDPALLGDEAVPQAVKDFLREGYDADVGHSEEALALVEKYAQEYGRHEEVRQAFLASIDAFDRYLQARLERAEQYEGS